MKILLKFILGIRECEIIQWFVEPEARVEEFDKICEVQSDKASVDIPSRFTGVIKRLHYEAGEMAIVGKPLVDIDVQEEVEGDESPPGKVENTENASSARQAPDGFMAETKPTTVEEIKAPVKKGTHASLATPAVRHLTKELNVDINDVNGTGRDGRVTKEDIFKFTAARDAQPANTSSPAQTQEFSPPAYDNVPQTETAVPLTNIQNQMFKTMTRSLTIPHFLYADEIDFSALHTLRQRLNTPHSSSSAPLQKLSYLPFVIKAMSLAIQQYPVLNARVEVDSTNPSFKPSLIMRSQHNIGIAMDTPSGLLVPVIKNVSFLTIANIATELARLQSLATSNKLTSADLTGGTITLSNIGSIGGTYVSPVIVEKEVAILGMGKLRTAPVFETGADGIERVVKKSICNFSWSADHRVVDGATMARAAEVVRAYVEDPARMLVSLR
jgi:2-oxoisovalerate dehydrogenase E2 component (dihydrolipoyl transacylase)